MDIIKLTKNVLMFEQKPGAGHLGPSDYEIRAGATIEAVYGTEDVRMPNGALCEKQVACFQTGDGATYYLLVEEMGETESAALTTAHR